MNILQLLSRVVKLGDHHWITRVELGAVQGISHCSHLLLRDSSVCSRQPDSTSSRRPWISLIVDGEEPCFISSSGACEDTICMLLGMERFVIICAHSSVRESETVIRAYASVGMGHWVMW